MTSSSPIPHITDETRACILFDKGYGLEDIAAKLFGKASDQTRQRVRKLIEDGSAKALGAH